MVLVVKAKENDIEDIAMIYSDIHDEIEKGKAHIGWIRSIYPTKETAIASLKRDDLFVIKDEDVTVGTVIFNHLQVKEYEDATWEYPCKDEEVMVMHTLVVDPKYSGKGYARAALNFYEEYALKNNCHYLRIDTNAINTVARAMYKKHGYKEVGIVPCVFNGIPDVKLVCLEKKIG